MYYNQFTIDCVYVAVDKWMYVSACALVCVCERECQRKGITVCDCVLSRTIGYGAVV